MFGELNHKHIFFVFFLSSAKPTSVIPSGILTLKSSPNNLFHKVSEECADIISISKRLIALKQKELCKGLFSLHWRTNLAIFQKSGNMDSFFIGILPRYVLEIDVLLLLPYYPLIGIVWAENQPCSFMDLSN